jgi:hypothetical protein
MKKAYEAPSVAVLGTVAEHTLATSCVIKTAGAVDSLFNTQPPSHLVGVLPTC